LLNQEEDGGRGWEQELQLQEVQVPQAVSPLVSGFPSSPLFPRNNARLMFHNM
jgi:hypothetical protein